LLLDGLGDGLKLDVGCSLCHSLDTALKED